MDQSNSTQSSSRIRVECSCGKTLAVARHLGGKLVRCPGCRKSIPVPAGPRIQRPQPQTRDITIWDQRSLKDVQEDLAPAGMPNPLRALKYLEHYLNDRSGELDEDLKGLLVTCALALSTVKMNANEANGGTDLVYSIKFTPRENGPEGGCASSPNPTPANVKCPICRKSVPEGNLCRVDVVGMQSGRTPKEQGQRVCGNCHREILIRETLGGR